MSKTIDSGTCRIDAAGVVVVGTNSGIVADVLHNGVGDDTITVDDDNQLGLIDTVAIAIEGAVAGSYAVERLTTLTFRVRLEDTAGAALAAAYGLVTSHTLEG